MVKSSYSGDVDLFTKRLVVLLCTQLCFLTFKRWSYAVHMVLISDL